MLIVRIAEFVFLSLLLFAVLITLSFATMGYLCNSVPGAILILAIVNAIVTSGLMTYYLVRLTKELTFSGKKEE